MNNYGNLCKFRSEIPKLRENTAGVDSLSEILSGNQFAFPGLYSSTTLQSCAENLKLRNHQQFRW